MTFTDVMQLTRTVSSNAAFEDEECEAYFNVLMTLPKDALIVEIGLEYGRSSSIALQVAKEKELFYWGIEPNLTSEWDLMCRKALGNQRYYVASYTSNQVALFMGGAFPKYPELRDNIACILVDGDHSYDTVLNDLNNFLPNVVHGGFACLHDCGRESLPDVIKAAKEYFEPNPQWDKYQQTGTLAIWQRK